MLALAMRCLWVCSWVSGCWLFGQYRCSCHCRGLVAQPFVANVRMTETLLVALHASLHSAVTARCTATVCWVPTTFSQFVWVRLVLAPAESSRLLGHPSLSVLCRYCPTCVLLCRHTCLLPLSAPVVIRLVVLHTVCVTLQIFAVVGAQTQPAPSPCSLSLAFNLGLL